MSFKNQMVVSGIILYSYLNVSIGLRTDARHDGYMVARKDRNNPENTTMSISDGSTRTGIVDMGYIPAIETNDITDIKDCFLFALICLILKKSSKNMIISLPI